MSTDLDQERGDLGSYHSIPVLSAYTRVWWCMSGLPSKYKSLCRSKVMVILVFDYLGSSPVKEELFRLGDKSLSNFGNSSRCKGPDHMTETA